MGYELKITGFETKKQAEEFANWYSGQGEQTASCWFECRKNEGTLDIGSMNVNKFNPWDGNILGMEIKPR